RRVVRQRGMGDPVLLHLFKDIAVDKVLARDLLARLLNGRRQVFGKRGKLAETVAGLDLVVLVLRLRRLAGKQSRRNQQDHDDTAACHARWHSSYLIDHAWQRSSRASSIVAALPGRLLASQPSGQGVQEG